jgi:hypothetical protein
MKKHAKSGLAMGLGIYVATLAVMGPVANSALANERRMHSSVCHNMLDNLNQNVSNGQSLDVSSSAFSYTFYCPIDSDSYLPHSAVNVLNVHGAAGSNGTNWSQACAHNYNGSNTTCGTAKQWGAGFTGAQSVDVSAWQNNAAYFPYLYSNIYKSGSIYGIYISN